MWGKRINYLCFIAFVLLGLLFYHNYVMMLLMVVLFGMPVLSFILTLYCKKRISVFIRNGKTSVGKNVPVDVYFEVENKSIIPIENLKLNILIKNHYYDNEEKYEIFIPAISMGTRTAKLDVSGKYCGQIIVGIESIDIEDLLGLFRFQKKVHCKSDFIVLPEQRISMPELALSKSGITEDSELQHKKGDDVSQIEQIREYIPGDKLQNIHWKLTSKKGEIQVKEYSMPYSDDMILLMELYKDIKHPEYTDNLLELFYAVSNAMINNGRRFQVILYNTKTNNLFEMRIQSVGDILSAIKQIYFMNPSISQTSSYDLFEKIYDKSKYNVIYLHNGDVRSSNELSIGVSYKEAVLTCLY